MNLNVLLVSGDGIGVSDVDDFGKTVDRGTTRAIILSELLGTEDDIPDAV